MDTKAIIRAALKDALTLAMAATLLLDLALPSLIASSANEGGTIVDDSLFTALVLDGAPDAPGPRLGHEFDLFVFDESNGDVLASSSESEPQANGAVAIQFFPQVGRRCFVRVARKPSAPPLTLLARFRAHDPSLLSNPAYVAKCERFRIVLFPTSEQLAVEAELEGGGLAATRPTIEISPATLFSSATPVPTSESGQ